LRSVLAGRRLYLVTLALYAVSRLLLHAWGVRFDASYDWQHLHDVKLLQHRLWESLLYTHAFTPFINGLAGVVLKTSVAHSVAIYHAIFLGAGAVLTCSVAYLAAAFRLPRMVALGTAILFACTPPVIYFEKFLHYEFLAATLVTASAVLLHRAMQRPTWVRFFSFLLLCSLLAYVRTTFHLVWVVAAVGFAVFFRPERFRVIVASAVVPLLLIGALYAKNLYLFGFFGTSSMLGFNLAFVTTRQLSEQELVRAIERGEVHPASWVSVYAPPQAYAEWVDLSTQTGIPVLDRPLRGNGQPNYNHHAYIAVSKLRMQSNMAYLRTHRLRYLRTVLSGLRNFFRPTTLWHPSVESTPHRANRAVLGGVERLYNQALHTFPIRPFGLYVFAILMLFVSAGRAAFRLLFRREIADDTDRLSLFMAFNCFYVSVLSCAVTTAELCRYRLIIEAFVWVLGLSLLRDAAGPLARFAAARRSAQSPTFAGEP
jgi:hypothetical protein